MNFHDELNDIRRLAGLLEQAHQFEYWMEDDIDEFLYHATSKALLREIQSTGVINPVSFWATPIVHQYYLETIVDEGQSPVTIKVPLTGFNTQAMQPDFGGLEEPLTYTLGVSEEEVWEAWEQTTGTWEDSLRLIGSISYKEPVSLDLAVS